MIDDESADRPRIPAEAIAHYGSGYERERLTGGTSRLELARSQVLARRYLPAAPAIVLDIGGGPGVYAAWLAREGYRVHLLDAVPLHVTQAREASARQPDHPFSAEVGDARALPYADESADAVLLFGPLYHLTERSDRLQVLAEARRVLRPGGVVLAAAISRFAPLLDGLKNGLLDDPGFVRIVERDLHDGQHRNPEDHPGYFTTAFFHLPDELAQEVLDAGLALDAVLAVEGPGSVLSDLSPWWEDEQRRELLLSLIARVEAEPSLLGMGGHLMAVGRTNDESVFNTGFSDIDATARPAALVSHQDRVNAQAAIQAYKQQAYAQLDLREGDRVLDVGCGSGDDARALARIVGPTGKVTGIDLSETMVAQARARSEGLGLPVEFQTGDIARLDFPDGAFAASRADRVLHHLDDPGRALAELARVVRPGGRVVVSEPDFDTFVIDHPDQELTRRILTVFATGGARRRPRASSVCPVRRSGVSGHRGGAGPGADDRAPACGGRDVDSANPGAGAGHGRDLGSRGRHMVRRPGIRKPGRALLRGRIRFHGRRAQTAMTSQWRTCWMWAPPGAFDAAIVDWRTENTSPTMPGPAREAVAERGELPCSSIAPTPGFPRRGPRRSGSG